ncbi:cytochrome P450 89A2-like [Magnolia sinica]|uniref:cytochrome P450 89A2-like n=1 Tax=Magnolia sinica TaxID=86752 RepID=UPI00265B1284|nr:cytochrome P450 89A2-like [Magnolia sinica]
MELWSLIFLSISLLLAAVGFLFNLPNTIIKNRKKLPPGPPTIPILGNILWLRNSPLDLEPILPHVHAKYGPIVTLQVGQQTLIFIRSHSLAHQALIQKGSTFSDRPPAVEARRIITCNQHNISSSTYGPLWRLLRRNLMSEILNPSRLKSYAPGRKWVLSLLIERLRCQAESGKPVHVMESFQYSMFSLLLLMCFGQKLHESDVKEIKAVQQRLLLSASAHSIFTFLPMLGKIIFRKQWNNVLAIRRRQEELFIPLIRGRKDRNKPHEEGSLPFSYVDSLIELELPEEGGRKLTEGEMVTLCSEFLNAGTDTTSTSLQWIMANLVRHQDVQAKLVEEIEQVVGDGREDIEEEDLQRMSYLKAVIMEGLRRHPPAHFVLPHAVSEEVLLEGYTIPKNATVNFMVAEMGWDGNVWEDPMEFRPERFLGEGEAVVDITGSREIKMMPFGAGRRICPGLGLAMLHVEYFVANLVREFEWMAVGGEEVDLAEKRQFTVVMKNPLKACITPRKK